MAVDAFLRSVQRDVAWGFFYGIVNFDERVRHHEPLRQRRHVRRPVQRGLPQGRGRLQRELRPRRSAGHASRRSSPTGPTRATTRSPPRWRPAARSARTSGGNDAAITRRRVVAERMVGVPGDEQIRTDESGFPINRAFADVPQDEPVVDAEPGYEDEVARVQPVRLPLPLRRHLEPVGRLGVQGEPVLPDDRGVHPAGHPRQRPRRMVRAALRRDPVGRRGPRHRRQARPRRP